MIGVMYRGALDLSVPLLLDAAAQWPELVPPLVVMSGPGHPCA